MINDSETIIVVIGSRQEEPHPRFLEPNQVDDGTPGGGGSGSSSSTSILHTATSECATGAAEQVAETIGEELQNGAAEYVGVIEKEGRMSMVRTSRGYSPAIRRPLQERHSLAINRPLQESFIIMFGMTLDQHLIGRSIDIPVLMTGTIFLR